MSSYTYPIKHSSGDLTKEQIHAILSNPRVIAKRIATLADQKFIADFLLQGRFRAQGGGIYYETGEMIFAADDPRAVAPGAEYPKQILSGGDVAAARTEKWGISTDITDEKISREGMTYVDKGLTKLSNTVVKQVDSLAWAVIASKVTDTKAASGAWTSVANVITSLKQAQAAREGLGLGLDLSTVALSTTAYASLVGLFLSAGVLPRESANPILSGTLPIDLLGFTWVTSPHVTGSDPWLIDREQLGGVADENLGSPGWHRSGNHGVEVQTVREPRSDKYELFARRVAVPVVTEPLAGLKITGTGLS